MEEPRKRIARKYWVILGDASKQFDLFSVAERLLVQTYFTDSGAEIFVTRLGKSSDLGEKTSTKSQSSFILTARSAIYPFYNLEELFGAVMRVDQLEGLKSSLFYSDSGVYYLFLEERSIIGVCSNLLQMSEFSKPMPPLIYSYIFEHTSEIIRDNAIEVLTKVLSKK